MLFLLLLLATKSTVLATSLPLPPSPSLSPSLTPWLLSSSFYCDKPEPKLVLGVFGGRYLCSMTHNSANNGPTDPILGRKVVKVSRMLCWEFHLSPQTFYCEKPEPKLVLGIFGGGTSVLRPITRQIMGPQTPSWAGRWPKYPRFYVMSFI